MEIYTEENRSLAERKEGTFVLIMNKEKDRPLLAYMLVAATVLLLRIINLFVPANLTLLFSFFAVVRAIFAKKSADYVNDKYVGIKENSELIVSRIDAEEYLPKAHRAFRYLAWLCTADAVSSVICALANPDAVLQLSFGALVLQQALDIIGMTMIAMFVNENESFYFRVGIIWILLILLQAVYSVVTVVIAFQGNVKKTTASIMMLYLIMILYFLYRYTIVKNFEENGSNR